MIDTINPAAPLADVPRTYDEVLQVIDIPQSSRYVSISRKEGTFIHDWVKDHGLRTTLEIGLAHGASSAAILSAHSGIHTCIDPFQHKDYNNRGLTNLETLSYRERMIFYEDYSHAVLPRLANDKRRYDFIFIDGDHRFDHVFVDFYYADLLLADGGYLLFHDAWMRSTQLVASFIRQNRRNYRPVRQGGLNLILFQKSGRSPVPWYHFKEFYTLRGVISQMVLTAMIRILQR
jgi:predicted O-methyltransferase YrrM